MDREKKRAGIQYSIAKGARSGRGKREASLISVFLLPLVHSGNFFYVYKKEERQLTAETAFELLWSLPEKSTNIDGALNSVKNQHWLSASIHHLNFTGTLKRQKLRAYEVHAQCV